MSSTQEKLETAATVMEKTGRPPQSPTRRRWPWVVVGLAIAILIATVALANVRNLALQKQNLSLQKQLATCQANAAKCVADANELARQFGVAARISLEKLDEQDQEEPEAVTAPVASDQPVGIDAGSDALKPPPTEKWK